MSYVGRFAPSPSGPLHAGSLVAALASWLDARAHLGRWLLRIEDVDGPRTAAGAQAQIMGQLKALGLRHDGEVWVQSTRSDIYASALEQLRNAGHAYVCTCTRQDIEAALIAKGTPPAPGQERIYPGTCRHRGLGDDDAARRTWRVRVTPNDGRSVDVAWHDRNTGPHSQDLTQAVGDFVLRRADGPFAYQLAVVVDDAAQGVTDVVRGMDLADNTARQVHLQSLLGLPTPRYLHVPVVLDAAGEKLSKSRGAQALDVDTPTQALAHLNRAAQHLGLPWLDARDVHAWLIQAVAAWRQRYAAQLHVAKSTHAHSLEPHSSSR